MDETIWLRSRNAGWECSLHIGKRDGLGVRHLFKRETVVNERERLAAAGVRLANTPVDPRQPGREGGMGVSARRRRAERGKRLVEEHVEGG